MKKPRIYVDTSVIGGCCDPEFEEWSKGLLRDFQEGRTKLLLSWVVEAEIADAPEEVKEIYRKFERCEHEFIPPSAEVIELANEYLRHKVLSATSMEDAQHIAIATVARADVLVSWNYKHVVNFTKVRQFNAVNLEMGYSTIAIYSPREVASHER